MLTKDRIDVIFEEATDQADYIVALFREVVPRWDQLTNLNGYVKCGAAMGTYIMGKAIAWDKVNIADPGIMNGGAWMNSGFSTIDRELGDWDIELPDGIEYDRAILSE